MPVPVLVTVPVQRYGVHLRVRSGAGDQGGVGNTDDRPLYALPAHVRKSQRLNPINHRSARHAIDLRVSSEKGLTEQSAKSCDSLWTARVGKRL